MHSSLTIFDDTIRQHINTDFQIELLDSSCSFAEGPVWNRDGYYLFSDIPKNVICKIEPGKSKEIYLKDAGGSISDTSLLSEQTGSNGLAYDVNGVLYICQHGNGAIAKWNGAELQSLLTATNGKPFNSPNDIVVHSDGSVFFSDPPYGLKDQKLNPEVRQNVAAFYCWRGNELTPFCTSFGYPNGVCLSPDETRLYCCSNKPWERFILEYDVKSLQLIRTVAEENSDGIKCDRAGNIFLCTKEGIFILNSEGKRMAQIKLDTIPANCCWGGEEGNDLFITARENIYLIKNLQK